MRVFAGLQTILSDKMSCDFLCGLPTAAFDYYILFDGDFVNIERRNCFPSWSWTGWKGCTLLYMSRTVIEHSDLKAWLYTKTWIFWYHRDDDGPPKLVGGSEANTKMSGTDGVQDWAGRRFDNRYCRHINTSQTEPIKSALPEKLSSLRPLQLLQFWTLSIYLTISRIDSPVGERSLCERGTIVDCNNTFCGSVRLDGYYFDEADINKPIEFILLSECKDTMPASEIDEADGGHLRLTRKDWDLYWVMPIQWDKDGITAERRGLGQIYQKVVTTSVAPGPSWKEIILG